MRGARAPRCHYRRVSRRKKDTAPKPVLTPDQRLADWERRVNPWIIVSAILPIVAAVGPNDMSPLRIGISIVCWLVFLVDLVVHVRLRPGYLRTGRGVFDLSIVVITAPWFLFTGGASNFVVVARLARLGRVVMASTRSTKLRRLAQQLGSVTAYALGLVFAAALIEKWVEPASSGFTTYGDALWFSFVTITTVGYGDITPVTAVGRTTAVILMFGGVALLGTLAGTLAAFFNVGSDKPVDADGNEIETREDVQAIEDAEHAIEDAADAASGGAPSSDVAAELAALRETVAALAAKLETPPPSA